MRIQSPIGFLCDHFQISKLLVKQKFQDLSCKLLSHFRICHHGIEEKIIQQVQLFQFFLSFCICMLFSLWWRKQQVPAEFICAVVLFPPYLFQFHTWNQIDRTALELSQICNFSVANDGRCVNHGMKKATGWVGPVCGSVRFLYFL